ncbi:DUF1257 domain-containing protein [Blastopirellula marina]|uniref:DUF1257 domain-containing protein n=1 Tax=Blastopirellula marina TaxID=124 RepID=A0A2S8GBJ1_9BACT|nr:MULTISPECIES: DUF1257 domain-containing protein [Pirellulaceae]PQO41789.1 DUF1257 domain-containing protein [Blastopirellula marina]RCS56341.1 DUF1257 domain-containing protein [Bremerella cremea]
MSHTVQIKTEIRDLVALRQACQRLSLNAPVLETVRLFSTEVKGHAIGLPNWRYPVVCDLPSGEIHFDNYEGRWGDAKEMNRLVQMYGVTKAVLEARTKGYTTTEQSLPDGSIKLTIQVGGQY